MINIGMVGVGAISGIYLKNITETFKEIRLVAVCDLVRERAEKAAANYNVPKIYDTMHELFADPEIDLVLNLTRPYEHFEVSKAALMAGKARLFRKTAGRLAGRRSGAGCAGRRKGPDAGRCARYLHGCGYPDLP